MQQSSHRTQADGERFEPSKPCCRCEAMIDTSLDVCPHCGQPDPTVITPGIFRWGKRCRLALRILWIGGLAALLVAMAISGLVAE